MSRWWRAYDEALDDAKLLLLSDRQHRGWFSLMCLASAYGGTLPEIKIVAVKLRMSVVKAAELITGLVKAGLVDESVTGFAPHNWSTRQYKSDASDPTNAERQKRFRNTRRNGQSTVTEAGTVTLPRGREQITDSEAETEKMERTRARALWPLADFWDRYPHKVGKQAAEKAFRKVEKSGVTTLENLMLGLARYVGKTDDRPWCNPATWLNEGRWEDQPAKENPHGNRPHQGNNGRKGADFFAGLAEVAADITRDGRMAGAADPEIPLGRVNIDG